MKFELEIMKFDVKDIVTASGEVTCELELPAPAGDLPAIDCGVVA